MQPFGDCSKKLISYLCGFASWREFLLLASFKGALREPKIGLGDCDACSCRYGSGCIG
jgi:hypothetical protein